VATNDGANAHPGWYLNLVANPETEIVVGADRIAVIAEPVTTTDRARLWPAFCDIYPNYQRDQNRTARELPVVLLRPRG
jgi:deazaflavin-dependent oxidoreductase (nitroreductase family)